MVTGSKELIRDINSHLVLETIVNDGPISRADLSKKLGLTKATISSLVQLLIDENLVIEVGSAQTEKGRKPILLDLNQREGHVISLDLGVDTITVLTCDLRGTHCRLHQYPNNAAGKEILPLLKAILRQTIEGLPPTKCGIAGISLGIHGVTHQNQAVFTPYYSLEGLDLAGLLQEHFQIPVFMENEANLSVLGERTFSFDYPNMINISVHSGIGLGILIDDRLYTGKNGYAGEFGHTIVVPGGRPCPCGNRGCIEQYASERAILREISEKKSRRITLDQFISLYTQKDADACHAMDEFILYMSVCINNILNTFNPDAIVINSSFIIYLPDIMKTLSASLRNRMDKYCTLLPSGLQDTAILLGGACVVIKNFLGIDRLCLTPFASR
ncbi:MAG: ROK family transcriptional regulator [Candidatus Limivivens sp.]|nr:ROK family transcriptional regulator [Candidatus Limivivens sp.]